MTSVKMRKMSRKERSAVEAAAASAISAAVPMGLVSSSDAVQTELEVKYVHPQTEGLYK